MTETGREYWMRVYAGQAMQALVGRDTLDVEKEGHLKGTAERAVNIASLVLDQLESTRSSWIHNKRAAEG